MKRRMEKGEVWIRSLLLESGVSDRLFASHNGNLNSDFFVKSSATLLSSGTIRHEAIRTVICFHQMLSLTTTVQSDISVVGSGPNSCRCMSVQ